MRIGLIFKQKMRIYQYENRTFDDLSLKYSSHEWYGLFLIL